MDRDQAMQDNNAYRNEERKLGYMRLDLHVAQLKVMVS